MFAAIGGIAPTVSGWIVIPFRFVAEDLNLSGGNIIFPRDQRQVNVVITMLEVIGKTEKAAFINVFHVLPIVALPHVVFVA